MSNTWFRLRRGFFLSFFPSDTPHYENVPFEVPSSWVWTNIEELFFVTKLAGFEYTDCLTKDTISSNNEVPIVRAQNVRMGYFVENTNEAISEALSQQLERSALTKKCLLMTFIGAGIGDTCIFPALKRCHLAPNVAKIEPYSNKIDLKYALYYLMSDLGQLGVRGISKSTAQPSLSMATIRSLEIALPPLAEQHRIVAEIEKLFELIDQIEQGKADLQTIIKQTKSKILDLAIHGKLVPQDPNDEPAIELLKRINPDFTPCDNGHKWKLPQSWCWAKGRQIFLPMKSTKPHNDEFLYIDIDSIDNKRQIINKIKSIKTANAPSRASRYTQKGDVVFSMVRPYLRNIAKVSVDGCIASTGFYVCSPIDDLNSEYCYYLMISDYVVTGLNQFMKGDNSPSINKSHIDEWLFPLPPFPEQQRIVQKIEKLFSLLDHIKKSLEV